MIKSGLNAEHHLASKTHRMRYEQAFAEPVDFEEAFEANIGVEEVNQPANLRAERLNSPLSPKC